MNEILFIISIALTFGAIVLVARFFGKEGLNAWIAVAMILANILITKQVTIFGLNMTLGNVMFASTYLCTDIISECYGKKASTRAVYAGMIAAIGYIVTALIMLAYKPNSFDYVQPALEAVFSFSAKITIASFICCFLANLADVYLFEKIKEKYPKALWLRNNISTILCNCTENFILYLVAFNDMYTIKELVSIAAVTSLSEAFIGLCDTPFVYWGRAACRKGQTK